MKKIGLKRLGVFAVSVFSLALVSCGGSSGGGDLEIDFEQGDLVDKIWYSNPYLSSSYNNEDAVIAYRFERGGFLKRLQYSGRVEETVGVWSLSNDGGVIEMRDNTIEGNAIQKWYIQSGTTANFLKLNSSGGKREFSTSMDGIEDVTADAYVVTDLRLVEGNYKADYRVDFEVYGQSLEEVVAMQNETKEETLVATEDYIHKKKFVLSDEGLERYLDSFDEDQLVRFYLKTKANDKFKLDENLYQKKLASLDYTKINIVKSPASPSVTVEWEAIDEDDVFYTVEILSSISKTTLPLFRSYLQPPGSGSDKSLNVSREIGAEIPLDITKMINGENYLIRITGLKYERDIDVINSINRSYNIQAKTVFTYKITW